MEWTQENVIEFTEIYKRKEIIWDPKHPKHFNKIENKMHWRNWEKKMNSLVFEYKKKMENLLSSLQREKMKMRKNS
jgi:3-deoxy-D-manno-octulosonic-acid transferase